MPTRKDFFELFFGTPRSDSHRDAPNSGDEQKRLEEEVQRFLDQRVGLQSTEARFLGENLTVDFLRQHFPEGSRYRPQPGERLRSWDRRHDAPGDIKSTRDQVYQAVQAHLRVVREREDERKLEEAKTKARAILSEHSSRVEKFLEITYRKVAAPDEYGDENPKAIQEETFRFLRKLTDLGVDLQRFPTKRAGTKKEMYDVFLLRLHPVAGAIADELRDRFDAYYRKRKGGSGSAPVDEMSGVEFELHISDALRSVGVEDMVTTPASGDQGGDLLFVWKGVRVVIQAKRYSGSVGNKAVQEAHAAKGFYGCDRAWVISNATYTPSALTLAKQLNVDLIGGDDLSDFDRSLKRRLDRLLV